MPRLNFDYNIGGKTFRSKLWEDEYIGPMFSYDIETDVKEDGQVRTVVLASACNGETLYFIAPKHLKAFIYNHALSIFICHNSAFDLYHTGEFINDHQWTFKAASRARDTLLLSRLYNLATIGNAQNKGQGLGKLVSKYLGCELPKEVEIGGKVVRTSYGDFLGTPITKLPLGYLHYSAFDTAATWLLHEALSPLVKNLDPEKELSHANQVKFLLAAYRITQRGACIDRNLIDNLAPIWEEKVETAKIEMEKFGYKPKTKGCDGRLYEIFAEIEKNNNLTLPKMIHKKKGSLYSKKAEDLKAFRHISFIDSWCDYLYANKIYNDFLKRLRDKDTIHTVYRTLMNTGRWSSSPNLQNIPRPTEELNLRRAFIARSGYILVSLDYSGAELVTLAQTLLDFFGFSKMAEMLIRKEDLHALTASKFYGCLPSEVTKEQRILGKVGNFGFAGGMSPATAVEFAKNTYGVEITLGRAEALQEAWLNAFPELRKFFALADKETEKLILVPYPSPSMPKSAAFYIMRGIISGQTETKTSKRSYSDDEIQWAWENMNLLLQKKPILNAWRSSIVGKIPEEGLGTASSKLLVNQIPRVGRIRAGCWRNSYFNTFFQGLQADLMNDAVFEVERQGFRTVNAIHDEIVVEVSEDKAQEEANKIETIMVATAKKYTVIPMAVEMKISKQWEK